MKSWPCSGRLKQGKQVYHITRTDRSRTAPCPLPPSSLMLKALGEAGRSAGIAAGSGIRLEAPSRFQLLLASDKTARGSDAQNAESRPSFRRYRSSAVERPAQTGRLDGRLNSRRPAPATGEYESERRRPQAEAAEAVTKRLPAPTHDDRECQQSRFLRLRKTSCAWTPSASTTVLNLVGELIIGKSMLQQALNEFAAHYPKEAMRGRFADAMAFQSRVLNDLQRSVMKVRMVPVEQLFRRFPRMVRDVAKQCGKEVELVLSGQDTDLDKSLLDAIAEPLTHLVRNAVGHGIESAEERARERQARARNHPSRGLSPGQSGHRGNQRRRARHRCRKRSRREPCEQGLLKRGRSRPARRSRHSRLHLPARIQHGRRDHRNLRPRRGSGRSAKRSARLKGTVQVETRPGPGHHVPAAVAADAGHHQGSAVSRGAASLCHSVECGGGDRARPGIRHASSGQLRSLAAARSCSAGGPLGKPRHGDRRNQPVRSSPRKDFRAGHRHLGERKLGLMVNGLEGEEELVIKALDDRPWRPIWSAAHPFSAMGGWC